MSDANSFNSVPFRLFSVIVLNPTGTAVSASLPPFVSRQCDTIVVDNGGCDSFLLFGTAAAPATATLTNSFRFATNKVTSIGLNPTWTNVSAITASGNFGAVRLMFGSGAWNPISS